MGKINHWNEIDKEKFKRWLPPQLSALHLSALRVSDSVFEEGNQQYEVHQCGCGEVFVIRRDSLEEMKQDQHENLFVTYAY